MEILLLDPLVPEALSWLQERHAVTLAPELADDPMALRKQVYKEVQKSLLAAHAMEARGCSLEVIDIRSIVPLDIEHLTIVGKADFLKDNNAKDIFNGLKSAVATEAPKPTPGPPSTKQPFLIKRLRVRVDRITIISGDGTDQRKVVVDQAFNYAFEARDITERNFDEKVSRPMGTQAVQSAVQQQPELLLDLARERLRKSVTEKLLGEK